METTYLKEKAISLIRAWDDFLTGKGVFYPLPSDLTILEYADLRFILRDMWNLSESYV